MLTIFKFELTPSCSIELPKGAEILTVAEQNDAIFMWVKLDPTAPKEWRNFAAYGTGHRVSDSPTKYIGTAFLHSRTLVLHVFELLPV